ncbi:unnamed protein product [Aureobasidium pullulans]|nr:unnamed protein product [Aureobasidium pullulans]
MAHACDLAIKFPECDLPDWFPSSTGINISHLIEPKLKSLELVEFNTGHFSLALS